MSWRAPDDESWRRSTLITGRVQLHTHDHTWMLERGQLVRIPPERHGLTALADSAVLLTVALH